MLSRLHHVVARGGLRQISKFGEGQRRTLLIDSPASASSYDSLGFRRFEHGLEWHRSKDELLASEPGAVLVGTPYEYRGWQSGALRQARKYASFGSHTECWEFISERNKTGISHGLHEIFHAPDARCLYFDLDGKRELWQCHDTITKCLQVYVHWFFCGERLGWRPDSPEAVVLESSDPSKYSCHIVFPEIQFDSYATQGEYMPSLMDGLSALKVDLGDGEEQVNILDLVVDRVPYTKFQLFRGPYACKLKEGSLRFDTKLEPVEYFQGNPLSCFASFADPTCKLQLPPMRSLLEWNKDLREEIDAKRGQAWQAATDFDGVHRVSPQDLQNLYMQDFQTNRTGVMDFVGLTELQVYEKALKAIHPERAVQWWSWFRICGVTHSMLEMHGHDPATRRRIWDAHHTWSSKYKPYCMEENEQMVLKCSGKRVSGIPLLKRLVQHDNPGFDLRFTHRPRRTWLNGSGANARGSSRDNVSSDTDGSTVVREEHAAERECRLVHVGDLRDDMPLGWKLEACVSEKSALKSFQRWGRSVPMFSATLSDDSGGKTRVVFFDIAADRNYDRLQEESWYSFANGKVKRGLHGDLEIIFGKLNPDGIMPMGTR